MYESEYGLIIFTYCLIFYEKPDNTIVYVMNKFGRYDNKKIGDYTSYNWQIIDLQVIYKKQFHNIRYYVKDIKRVQEVLDKKQKRIDRVGKIVHFLKDVI